jgi:hypothetical protein
MGAVSALRETSVVFAVQIGRVFLWKAVSAKRWLACVIVAAGAGIAANVPTWRIRTIDMDRSRASFPFKEKEAMRGHGFRTAASVRPFFSLRRRHGVRFRTVIRSPHTSIHSFDPLGA